MVQRTEHANANAAAHAMIKPSPAVHVYTRDIVVGANDSLAKIAALLRPADTHTDRPVPSFCIGRFVRALGGLAVDGITISEEELAIAKPHYRNVVICDLDTDPVPEGLAEAKYDTIVCADVLEHLSRPVAALQKLRALLKPHGRIILSIPNVTHRSVLLSLLEGRYPRRDEGLLDRTHVQFFDRAGLNELVSQAQLHVHSEDAVLRDLVDTEFANVRAESMPPAVVNFACSGPDSQVYQFIWVLTVSPPAHAALQPRFEPAATPRFQLQAMQDLGEGFDGRLSLFATGLQQPGIQRLRFETPVHANCKQLRVGLADRAGVVEFMGLHIRDATDKSVFAWAGSWTPVVKSNACAWSSERGPHGGTLVRATASDAFVVLDLPTLASTNGELRLELELSCAATSVQDASAEPIERLTEAVNRQCCRARAVIPTYGRNPQSGAERPCHRCR